MRAHAMRFPERGRSSSAARGPAPDEARPRPSRVAKPLAGDEVPPSVLPAATTLRGLRPPGPVRPPRMRPYRGIPRHPPTRDGREVGSVAAFKLGRERRWDPVRREVGR